MILIGSIGLTSGYNTTGATSTNQTVSVPTNLTVTVDGVKYEGVRFELASPTTVKIWHSTGIAVVPTAKLPPEIQQQLGYDPQKAAEWQASQIEFQAAQQRKRVEQEAAKREAEIEKHTYSVKLLKASFDNIPNGTVIIVNAFTDGKMISSDGGFSSFTIYDGKYNSFSKARCQAGANVFKELMNLNGDQSFQMFGYKSPYEYDAAFVVAEIRPLDAEAWYGLGATDDKEGQTSEAISAYLDAVKLKPDYAEAFLGLAAAWEKFGRSDRALAALKQAVKVKPDYAEAWLELSTAYQQAGQTNEAESAMQRAKELNREPPK